MCDIYTPVEVWITNFESNRSGFYTFYSLHGLEQAFVALWTSISSSIL